MDVILHLGAHRTGSTSFQTTLRRNLPALNRAGLAFWGPHRTRGGLFAGVMPQKGDVRAGDAARRARGRVQLRLQKAHDSGALALLVSDENMIGSVRSNMRTRALYPDIGDRVARYAALFDGQITRLVLSIRSQDTYWPSAIAYGVARGHPVPKPAALSAIAVARRTWRDVITDLARAVPRAQIVVAPFEDFAGKPTALLREATDRDVTLTDGDMWLNRTPDAAQLRDILTDRGDAAVMMLPRRGAWQPFNPEQRASLREAYADDMHWLIAGADGLATLTEDPDRIGAGQTPPMGPNAKGQGYDRQKGRMAHSG